MIPEAFRKREQKAGNVKERVEVAKRYRRESQWNRGHFRMKEWESEKHKNWSMPEGFKGSRWHGTTLFWVLLESGEHVAGQWCNWL